MSQFDADASSRESTHAEMEMKSRETKPMSVPALRAARTEQPAVAEMPTHSFVQPATRLKP